MYVLTITENHLMHPSRNPSLAPQTPFPTHPPIANVTCETFMFGCPRYVDMLLILDASSRTLDYDALKQGIVGLVNDVFETLRVALVWYVLHFYFLLFTHPKLFKVYFQNFRMTEIRMIS